MDYVIQPNSELRAHARQQLQGVWWKMALAFFILFLIYLLMNLLSSLDYILYLFCSGFSSDTMAAEQIQMLLSFGIIAAFSKIMFIIMFVIRGPFDLGFSGFFLKRVRAQEINIRDIFDGFKRFLPSLLLWLFTVFFIFLWSLIFVIPVIIIQISGGYANGILSILFLILLLPAIIKSLSYSMAFFIMYDNPGIKPLAALKKSQIMMKEWKWKFFLLLLSFIGWFLLGLLTLGIGYFWLFPYINLSIANFYENLRIGQDKGLI